MINQTVRVYDNLLNTLGNTPLIKLNMEDRIYLYAKVESVNPTGSVKDRAARYIIEKMLELKRIDTDTLVIESTSGNFGIALAAYCKYKGIKFCSVIDPNISTTNEKIIRALSTSVVKVTERDVNDGYLLNRIKKVDELLMKHPNSYWVNQYANPYNAEAYYHTVGKEICEEVKEIDYLFVGISSGGTITGLSRRVKEHYPNAKVIAVDIVGSVIFGGKPKKRFIPGIGSSRVPEIIDSAKIDDFIMIDEKDVVKGCEELLKEHMIFAGGSSGAVYTAINQYFSGKELKKTPNVVTIFADRGDRYADTIYNEEWCNTHFNL